MSLELYNQAMELDAATGKPMRKTSVVGFVKAAAVAPSDTAVIDATKGLYVGVAGDAVLVIDGVSVTFKALPVGFHNLRVTAVKATGTLAASIVALY